MIGDVDDLRHLGDQFGDGGLDSLGERDGRHPAPLAPPGETDIHRFVCDLDDLDYAAVAGDGGVDDLGDDLLDPLRYRAGQIGGGGVAEDSRTR